MRQRVGDVIWDDVQMKILKSGMSRVIARLPSARHPDPRPNGGEVQAVLHSVKSQIVLELEPDLFLTLGSSPPGADPGFEEAISPEHRQPVGLALNLMLEPRRLSVWSNRQPITFEASGDATRVAAGVSDGELWFGGKSVLVTNGERGAHHLRLGVRRLFLRGTP